MECSVKLKPLVKGTVVAVHVMKAYRKSRNTDSLIPNLSIRFR